MPKLLRLILTIIVVALSVFGLITESNEVIPYLMLLLGVSMLVTGLFELQKDKKGFWGYMGIVVSLFLFFVAIQGFLLN
jgi:hypothetical protein